MVAGPSAASPAGATFFGLSGSRLRQVGVALMGIGLVLFFLSFVPILLAFNRFMQDPFGSAGSMFGSFFVSFLIGAIGIITLGVGGFALRLGLVRPVTGYVATEAAPAIQTAATAFAAGIREAGFRASRGRSEEHTAELQSRPRLVCRLLLEKKKHTTRTLHYT